MEPCLLAQPLNFTGADMFYDPHGDQARAESKALNEQQNDAVAGLKLFFRLLTLPLWLPFSLWLKQRQKRKMAAFAEALRQKGINEHRQLALEWIAAHPEEYPWGEYDPRLPKLQESFRKILN
jgi:hypothetical protein